MGIMDRHRVSGGLWPDGPENAVFRMDRHTPVTGGLWSKPGKKAAAIVRQILDIRLDTVCLM